MQIRQAVMIFGAAFLIAAVGRAQSTSYASRPEPLPSSPSSNGVVDPSQSQPAQSRPSASEAFHDFVMSAVGPYSVAMGAFTAGIHQATNNPPEWHQGAAALGKRFGSNMGISAVGSATRIGIGELLNQDTSFHKCKCEGVPRRLAHAAFSAVIAHQRSDGHAVFSIPGLAAPYVATTTAVDAWYPSRYGIKDALRMGNYNLLGTVGTNIAFEFLPASAARFLSRIHLNNRRIASDTD
jgi:hypothetical protein